MPFFKVNVAAIVLFLLTGWSAKNTCPLPPSVEPIDRALAEARLSPADTEKVQALRASVAGYLARQSTDKARRALLDAMAVMGYAYRRVLPPTRGLPCPPGKWLKAS